MEANGRILLPPANTNYSINELWFIQQNLPDSRNLKQTDFAELSGYARIFEQARMRKCSFHQIDNEKLTKMTMEQFFRPPQSH